ncbi:hypothetical protein JZ751_010480 [Albula glossodonta]|uniref:Uncharacterized protein n=1 Tax=Albula glossodonta TaxID=121402 RepID=A0A8T2NV11_9TELE|nr:hypothetical protein JZ751_010480 [Albula glossodonta]
MHFLFLCSTGTLPRYTEVWIGPYMTILAQCPASRAVDQNPQMVLKVAHPQALKYCHMVAVICFPDGLVDWTPGQAKDLAWFMHVTSHSRKHGERERAQTTSSVLYDPRFRNSL